jgi:hypothetical protein
MRLAAVVSVVALALAAGAHATPRRGTVSGVVKRGPVAPVCAVEQPCDEPAANVTLLFIRNGNVIVRTLTNVQGRYRVRLPAGAYSVRRAVVHATVDRKLEPNHARVFAGRLTRLDFSIDTGIR